MLSVTLVLTLGPHGMSQFERVYKIDRLLRSRIAPNKQKLPRSGSATCTNEQFTR